MLCHQIPIAILKTYDYYRVENTLIFSRLDYVLEKGWTSMKKALSLLIGATLVVTSVFSVSVQAGSFGDINGDG